MMVFFFFFQAPDKSLDSVDEKRSSRAHFADGLATRSGESTYGRDPVACAGQPHNIRDPVQGPEDARVGGQGLDICCGGCECWLSLDCIV